jgi:hypothetical protein
MLTERARLLHKWRFLDKSVSWLDYRLKNQLKGKEYDMLRESRKEARIEQMKVEYKLDQTLPIVIEGFLGEDEQQVDENEHGIVNELYHYLGCPNIDPKKPFSNKVLYDRLRDITEILKANDTKFLRVTIEAIELGSGENCPTCEKRFQCLTQR